VPDDAVEARNLEVEFFRGGDGFHPGGGVGLRSAAGDLRIGILVRAGDQSVPVRVAGDDELSFPVDERLVPCIAAAEAEMIEAGPGRSASGGGCGK
jgi:hypothetical protein